MNKRKFPAPLTPRARRASLATMLALCALALSAAPRSTAQQPQSAAAETTDSTPARDKGTINVRILGEDNQPVAGAFVSAFQQGASTRVSYDNSGAASGRYVLTNLDPGVYRVSAFAPGYVEETDPTADPSEPRNLYRPGDSVTLRMTKGGIVTGKVTDAEGEPVIGARVAVVRVRDGAGRLLRQTGPVFSSVRERRTDDRGVYRLYGLPAGTYVVLAGGRSGAASFAARPSAYDSDAPTYYPSATRDGAAEVQVQAGQEVTDIDIRHRGEQGRVVSGTVAGAFGASDFGSGGASVILKHLSGATAAFAFVFGNAADGTRSFTFDGVADGDYEVSATSNSSEKETGSSSAPLRVTVRGADVTGLRLALAPLGSIAGRVSFEPLPAADAKRAECQNLRAPVPQESLIFTRREDGATPSSPFMGQRESVPDTRGEFTVRNLEAGRYRFTLRLLDDSLFVRAITLPAGSGATTTPGAATAASTQPPAAAARVASDLSRNGFGIKAGDRIAGVQISVAAGAGALSGRVAPASEGEGLPEALRLHLIPAERERVEDVIRYQETRTRPDGTFSFRNLAPGRYLLIARPVPENELRAAEPPRPVAWDAAARAELRREAEAAKNSIELQPCQRAEDFTLRLTRAAGTN